jgi:hypothetical protein
MNTDRDRSRERRQEWKQQPSETLNRVPDDMYAYMETAVMNQGKRDWAQEQSKLLDPVAKPKIPSQYHSYIRYGAALLGALTFSVAPTWLARQTGRGMWADSIGLVGGGIAGYATHELATQAIVGYTLKRRYRRNYDRLKQLTK